MRIQMGPIGKGLVQYESNPPAPSTPPTPPAPPATPPGSKTEEKVFTQEEVNALIAGRARDLVKRELGVDSLEAAKARLTRTEELEEAQKTEAQKLLDKAKKDGRKEAETEAEERIATIQAEANRRLIRADVMSQASALGFHDSDDAWLRVTDAIDDSRIKVDDKGNVIGTKVVLEKIAKDKPYLLKSATTPGTPRFDNNGIPITDLDAKTKAAAENARQAVFGGPGYRRMG